jgi:hypothetical protein
MKLAGFLLLVAGWGILVVAIVILPSNVSRSVFIVAGLVVEILGLVLAGKNQRQLTGERE